MKLTIFRISSLFLRFWSSRFHFFLLEHIRDELDTILSSVPLALLRAVISAAAHHSYTSLHSFTAISCWGMITIRHKDTAGRQKCSNSLVWTRLKFALHMPCNDKQLHRKDGGDNACWSGWFLNQHWWQSAANHWTSRELIWSSDAPAKSCAFGCGSTCQTNWHVLWVRHMR